MKINVHLKQQLDRRKDELRNMTMYLNNTMVQQNQGQMILEELENQKFLNNSVNSNGNNSTTLGYLNASTINANNNGNNYSMMNVSMSGMNGNNYSTLNNTLNFIKCKSLHNLVQKELIKQNND